MGENNRNFDYMMLSLDSVITIWEVSDHSLKGSSQLGSRSPRFPQILGSISKHTESRAKVSLCSHVKRLNKLFKYCLQFWSLYLTEDLVELEKATTERDN